MRLFGFHGILGLIQPDIPMFCPECGTKIEDTSARFCPGCGHAIGAPEPAQSEKPFAVPAETFQAREPVRPAVAATTAAPSRRLSGCAIAAIILGSLAILAAIGIGSIILLIGATTSPAVDAFKQHLALIANGDDRGAYEMTTSQAFQSNISLEQFQTFVNNNPGLRHITATSISSRSIENNTATLEGTITLENGEKTVFQMKLIKEGDSWKILGFDYGPAVQP